MRYLACLLAAAPALMSTAASAQSAPVQPAPVTAPIIVVEPLVVAQIAEPRLPEPAAGPMVLDLAALGDLNGRQGDTTTVTVLTNQDLTAVNYGNTITADSVNSGQITLGASAFQGFAGVGNFVINSGHNNNLQGSLTINIVTP